MRRLTPIVATFLTIMVAACSSQRHTVKLREEHMTADTETGIDIHRIIADSTHLRFWLRVDTGVVGIVSNRNSAIIASGSNISIEVSRIEESADSTVVEIKHQTSTQSGISECHEEKSATKGSAARVLRAIAIAAVALAISFVAIRRSMK